MCSPWLPDEMWIFLFRYLSVSKRLSIRATCKYFRDLVDNSDLWKNWVLDLRDEYEEHDDEYDEEFWELLRRRRVTSACLCSYSGWSKVVNELPGLTTMIINSSNIYQTLDFRSFTNLKHLYLTYIRSPEYLEEFLISVPQRLTHLTLCHDMYGRYPLPIEISSDLPFQKLRSFSFHCSYDLHPVNALHFFLSSLPQLQHFSLSMFTLYRYEGKVSDLPPLINCSLTSLEFVNCNPRKLPRNLMKMLRKFPFLRSLAIFCLYEIITHDDSSKLSTWLKDLPALTSLLVSNKNVSQFVSSIPRGLTRLSLLPHEINSEEMAALSPLLPNLCDLRLKPLTFLGSDTALIPQYFPKLKILRIIFKQRLQSGKQVPDDAFLSLASLKELEILEIQNEELPPAALVSQLRALTNNRLQIYCRPKEDQLRSCNCAF